MIVIQPTKAGWHDNAWNYRMRITVESTQVDADLTDFPVYLDLSNIDAGHGFWRGVKSAGEDIRITQSDGETEVPVEIVAIDTSAYTGEIHFKADNLSDTDDTQFWLYYGNSSATMPADTHSYGKNNVWDLAGFGMVHHFFGATATDIDDSTSNNNDVTTDESTSPGYNVPAKLGEGVDFDGTDVLSVADHDSLDPGTGDFSISAWVQLDTITTTYGITSKGNWNSGQDNWQFTMSGSEYWALASSGSGWWVNQTSGTSTIVTDTWQLVTITLDRDGDQKIYIDGIEQGSQTASNSDDINSTSTLRIGETVTYGTMDGTLDELRFSDVARSASWVSTEYNNQNAPESFLTLGEQEVSAEKTWYDVDWSHRIKLTIDHTKVGDNLSDFPVYFDLGQIDSGDTFWSTVKSAGEDLRITHIDGHREVPIEIVDIHTGNKTGEIHFKSDLSDSNDTIFYLYFGNSSASTYNATDPYGAQNVWNANYKGVWHFSGSSATEILDSTSNNNDVTSSTGTISYNQTGQTGQAIHVGASDACYLEVPDNDSLTFGDGSNDDPLTLISWFKVADLNDSVNILRKYVNPYEWMTQYHGTNQNLRAFFRDQSAGHNIDIHANDTNIVTADTWVHSVVTYSGNENVSGVKIYMDATENVSYYQNTGVSYTAMENTSSPLRMAWVGSGSELFMSEARVMAGELSSEWISTEYNNQNSPSTFYTLGDTEALADAAWYHDDWTARLAITVQDNHVSADLNDFPVYLDLSQIPSSHTFWTGVKSGGEDIRITQADGVTEVPVEVVAITPGSNTGEVHFKAPELLSTQDQIFYLYYSNASATEPTSGQAGFAEDVWSAYEVVYHLSETSGSTAYDSTGNYDGSYTAGSTDAVSGPLETGQSFAGDQTDEIDGTDLPTTTKSAATMSLWIDGDADYVSGNNNIWKAGGVSLEWGNFGNIRARHEDLSDTFFDLGNDSDINSSTPAKLIHVTYDGSNRQGYVDGLAANGEAATGDITPGTYNSNEIGLDFPGVIDECRLTNQALSSDWISTEYANQNSPESFYTVSAEETGGTPSSGPGKRKAIMISREPFYLPKESF